MKRWLDPNLRTRLLMLVLFGVVLPLGLMGIWTSYSAKRTGIQLVHERLREALAETVNEFQQQWIQKRSSLLDLSESAAVISVLDGSGSWVPPVGDAMREELFELWAGISPFVVYLELRDLEGELVGRLPDALGPEVYGATEPQGTLDREYPVLARFTGEPSGTMTVRFRVEGLLPPGFLAQGVGGSVPGIFDARSGASLSPTVIEPTLFSRDLFTWRGEEWVTEERLLEDPPLRFALAAPLEPVTTPFDRAARRGALAILLAVILSVLLVSVFSKRIMRPLDRLVAAAGTVASGDLTTRLEETGPPGVRDTARAFNAMSEALDHTLQQLSQKEATAAVGEFAADLAHEVRNPLTAIRTDLQRAQRKLPSDPNAATKLVERAVVSVDRLNGTVSDFLRVARSGQVSLTRCDLRSPVAGAIRASEPQRNHKGCTFGFADPGDAVMIMGDPDALQGVFLNLLLNAVDAIEPGQAVGVRLVPLTGSEVAVEVWDEGPGIPEGLKEVVFDPFVTTKDHGTGLGLAIARRVARAHGSDLVFERRFNQTVFRMTLPTLSA